MFLRKYLFFLFLNFSIQDPQIIKQWLDLEDYTDMSAGNVIVDENFDSNVTYICGENLKNDCECKDDLLKCTFWFKDANVKPLKKNFEIRKAYFFMSNIAALKRDKILPDNEDTVEWLTFSSAGIKFIEAGAFDKFLSLVRLTLSENELTFINENILSPKLGSTLLSLDLSQNNFTIINPMVFKNMKKLTYLGFDSNRNPLILTNVFPEMNLEILIFSFCGIKTLEENVFKNLQKLRILLLEGNNLTVIPATLKYLPNLYQLELGHNLISEIEKNIFLPNPKLSVIVLNNNPKLKFIGDCTFCGLHALELVKLSSCHQLSYIHENAFGAISTGKSPNFELFAINECNISVLSENLLDWKNMETLDIGGNPFACNCSMAWLFADLLSDSSIYDKKIKRRYRGHKYILGCFPPLDTAHKHFFKPLNITEISEPCKNTNSSTSPFWWIFIIAFGFISTIGIYVYRRQLNSTYVCFDIQRDFITDTFFHQTNKF